MIGVVSLLAVVTMRQDYAGSGADAASLTVTANALVSVRDWTFLFGPGLMPVFNALLFGTLLYRSRLVPRLIPTIGLVGAPLLFAAFVANLFGIFDQVSTGSVLPHPAHRGLGAQRRPLDDASRASAPRPSPRSRPGKPPDRGRRRHEGRQEGGSAPAGPPSSAAGQPRRPPGRQRRRGRRQARRTLSIVLPLASSSTSLSR